ncbi:hypothetical protein [uncultured Rhodoblastus sp.]|uniref:hypothetical protein n=1 Tax=uncultured Rhodoblastus sp. TaxID=543037 RepID=UPI0025E9095A|nr:hypothetical protein [uncultured Rhodoblastus sp.]
MTLIQYLCAICGAGKTRALALYAKNLAGNGEKVLLVQKTIKLINATVRDEIGTPRFPVTIFHCDDNGIGNVSVRLLDHFKNAGSGGEIVVTTHETFSNMSYFEGKAIWHLIVDEIPQIDDMKCFNLSETHSILSERVTPVVFNENWYHLQENDGLEALAKNPNRDSLWEQLKGTVRKISSDHWDVYATRKSYDALIAGESVDGEDFGKIEFFSAMRPSIFDGFKSVIIAGANFKNSMLYKVWAAKEVPFMRMPPFLKKLLRAEFRAGTHENGDRLKIYYAYNSNWSKYLRDQSTALTTGEIVERKANIIRVIGEMMGAEEFTFMANKDWAGGAFASWKKAIRMSGSPHGDNSFMGLHNIAVLSALNPTPDRGSFLKEVLGLGNDDIREVLYHEPVYQALCRISIRNPGDMTPKRVVVMDYAMAIWIRDMFPGSEVMKLDMGEGAKPETRGRKKSENPSPAAIKKQKQRAKWAAQAASAI